MDKNRYRKTNRSEYIGSKLTIITFSLISIESIIIRNRWLLFYCYRYRFRFHDIVDFIAFVDQNTSSLKKAVKIGLVSMTCRQQAYVFICFSIHCGFTPHWIVLNQLFLLHLGSLTEGLEHLTYNPEILISSPSPCTAFLPVVGLVEAILGLNCDKRHGLKQQHKTR